MTTLLQHFADVIEDELFIGISTQDLQQEIQQNMWLLSKPQGYNESIQDWIDLINCIIENRKQQVVVSGQSMIFYLWFDEQASQLRFNLINGSHKFLPFHTHLEIVPTFSKIVEAFWNAPYHNGIPFSELDDNPDAVSNTSSNVLHVYRLHLEAK